MSNTENKSKAETQFDDPGAISIAVVFFNWHLGTPPAIKKAGGKEVPQRFSNN